MAGPLKGPKLHDGQLRKSGEPYFIHPIAVAKILAQLGMDEETIVGGLFADVVEDTGVYQRSSSLISVRRSPPLVDDDTKQALSNSTQRKKRRPRI